MAEYRGFNFSVYRDLLNDHTSPYLLYRYIDGAVRTYGEGTLIPISEEELKELARIIIRKRNDGNIPEGHYLFIVQRLKIMRNGYRRIRASDPREDFRNHAEILANRTLAILNILDDEDPTADDSAAAASSSDGDPEDIDEDPRSRKTKYKINNKRKSARKSRKTSKSKKTRRSSRSRKSRTRKSRK